MSKLASLRAKVYVIEPLVVPGEGRHLSWELLLQTLDFLDCEVLDPDAEMCRALVSAAMNKPEGQERQQALADTYLFIAKDRISSMVGADLLLVLHRGQCVDSGVASIIGAAGALGKTIIIYRDVGGVDLERDPQPLDFQLEYWSDLYRGGVADDLPSLKKLIINFLIIFGEEKGKKGKTLTQ